MELVYKLSGLPLKGRLKRQRFCSRFCENIKLIYGEMFVNAEEHCMLNFRFLALCRRCSFVGCSGVWAAGSMSSESAINLADHDS